MNNREKANTKPLLIFDCDGVLVDSEAIGARIEFEALRNAGCLISFPDYLEISLGRSDEDELWKELAAEWSIGLPDDFPDQVRRKTEEALIRELRPIEGIKDALDRLPYERCIASGASNRRLELTLGLTGLADFFQGRYFSGKMVTQGKPAPDLFLLAAEKMGFNPQSCIVLEDSVNGVLGAVKARMTVFGFTGGSHCYPGLESRLKALGCRAIYSDPGELPSLIEQELGLGD